MIPLLLPGFDVRQTVIQSDMWPEALHHLHVRRAKPGTELFLGNGAGERVRVRLLSIDKRQAELELLETLPVASMPEITLWLCMLEKSALEEALQLVCQVGIGAVRFVTSKNTGNWPPLKEQHVARLKKIMLSSCIQSEQAWLPELDPVPVAFDALPWHEGSWHVAVERMDKTKDASGEKAPLHVLIGPEGGWTPQERDVIFASKATAVDLGHSILRAQTAALIACWQAANPRM